MAKKRVGSGPRDKNQLPTKPASTILRPMLDDARSLACPGRGAYRGVVLLRRGPDISTYTSAGSGARSGSPGTRTRR